MKKLWILAFAFGAITMAACNEKSTTTETATATENTTTTTETVTTTTDYDAQYNDRADQISTQMASDLTLDPETQAKAREVYYNRSRRLGEVEQKYTTAGDTTGMYSEMQTVYTDTDTEFKGILSPEQYRSYETNRMNYDEMKYKSGDMKIKSEGDESKLKSDDLKMKTDGDESKVESGDMKMKTDGDESKTKTSDSKSKTSPTDSKYKSGDTKVKVETK